MAVGSSLEALHHDGGAISLLGAAKLIDSEMPPHQHCSISQQADFSSLVGKKTNCHRRILNLRAFKNSPTAQLSRIN
jgi:hypothetical protein